MDAGERITGGEIKKVFEWLAGEKTFLRIASPSEAYQALTMVTDIRTAAEGDFFRIDAPQRFHEAQSDEAPWRWRFEFTGAHHIPFAFVTSAGHYRQDEIWFKFPEVIFRLQRRHHFRLEAPAGSKLYFVNRAIRYECGILDISLGGSKAMLIGLDGKNDPPSRLNIGGMLSDIELVFPVKGHTQRTGIKKAQIIRREKNDAGSRLLYALEFIDFDPEEEKNFLSFIYGLQRLYLRERLPLSDDMI